MNSVIQVNNSDSKQDLEKGPSCNGIMKAQKTTVLIFFKSFL